MAVDALAQPIRQELRLYLLPHSFVSWEGKGFRETAGGWESKVKFNAFAGGLIFRHPIGETDGLETRLWATVPNDAQEEGSLAPGRRSQTSLQNYAAEVTYLRARGGRSRVEWHGGLQGLYQSLKRDDIIINDVNVPGTFTTRMGALGIVLGLSGQGTGKYFLDWDVRVGHFPVTFTDQKASGSTISNRGFSYSWRLGAGMRLSSSWVLGLGYMTHFWSPGINGGRVEPGGPLASHSLNQTSIDGPYLSVSHAL